MLKLLLTIITSLSARATASLTSQIDLIRNPTHHATYSPPYAPASAADKGRLIVIGDVHGMLDELEHLLHKVDYSSSNGDRVIFVGDLINKGPQSAGVLEYAMSMNATSVRGNHEDKVLRVWAGAEEARVQAEAKGKDGDKAQKHFEKNLGSGKLAALDVARSLTPEQRAWIAAFPVALRLGQLPGIGEAVVVHGGLAPGLDLENQEQWAMYNIRALIDLNKKKATRSKAFKNTISERLSDDTPGIDPTGKQLSDASEEAVERYSHVGHLPTGEFEDGKWWVETWNEVEKAKPESERLTVLYGHDSKRKLQVKDYSYGLDTKCVDGKKLTALVLEPAVKGAKVVLEKKVISVKCPSKS